jgi:FAD:protein FMN transferase
VIETTTFEALGTETRVSVLDGDVDLAEMAVATVLARVDETYSRFRSDSELSRLHARPNEDVALSPLLATAVETALVAARATDGLVDPTVGRRMRLIGYDDDFTIIRGRTDRIVLRIERIPGWKTVRYDQPRRRIALPAGVELDLGATGKALAAELAADAAVRATGARGVLVSVGGDIAFCGETPLGGWEILVTDDSRASLDGHGERIRLHQGGVATSSTSVRRWVRGEVELHHIIDPRTGLSAESPWRTVTVLAGRCVTANAAATAAIVLGAEAPAWLQERSLAARLVDRDGAVHVTGGWPAPVAVAA